MKTIRTAVLSVSEKTGLVPFARGLLRHGVKLIATGGTRSTLEAAGLATTDIQQFTGNPEAFGGRMKTLSFRFESALLFDRERDAEEASALGIDPIDLVVCNLYPFKAVRDRGVSYDELIENIDIGGPTMLRSAAKNYKSVAVVCDPEDYSLVLEQLDANQGSTDLQTRSKLMRKAFAHTADYDRVIAQTLADRAQEPSARFSFHEPRSLRYGENPHQDALLFLSEEDNPGLSSMEVLGGKALSFNNIVDLVAAADAVTDLSQHGCAIIKHTNPCGLATANSPGRALELAWSGDPVSAFGSILAFNSPLSLEDVAFLELDCADKTRRKFVEVILAPSFSMEALDYLHLHDSLRIVRVDPARLRSEWDYRFVAGGLLAQRPDRTLFKHFETVTERTMEPMDEPLILFGLQAVRSLKSNAICVVQRVGDGELRLLGMGAGQPNRVTSSRLAVEKARENIARETGLQGATLDQTVEDILSRALVASDAFFPFADNIEILAGAGIRSVVQPGGSIRDKSVIRMCNEKSVAMVMTGIRHFKH